MNLEVKTNKSGLRGKKRNRREDKHQDAGLVEKYKMKMKLLSPLKGFMSLLSRILLQKQCFIFVQNNVHLIAITLSYKKGKKNKEKSQIGIN